MRITDLNREGGIGSNSLLVEMGDFAFVVDAGLHPKLTGLKAMPDYSILDGKHLDFIIITHCHLDHIGSLPMLLAKFPETRVILSHSSQMLIERMLHNSCNVMKRQKAEQNIPEYPLFTHEDIDRLGDQLEILSYGKALPLYSYSGTDEISIRLHAAGHVAGAGGIEVEHQGRRVFFTGDVLFDDQRILPGAKFPCDRKFDTLILETTRGETESNPDRTRASEIDRLLKSIRSTYERGGSVLIPVFALGRMQEILSVLNDARKDGRIPQCPVFGAGLGLDLAGYFDQIAKRTGHLDFSQKVIKELRLRRPPRSLVPGKEPPEQGIYVLSSGMLVEKTPSYGMAASLLAHARNSICFVGYCDPGTPGGKLLATGVGEIFVFETLDYQTPVRAQLERFELSGHADREELLEFAQALKPSQVVLTHGDAGARQWFSRMLSEGNTDILVVDPKPLQPIDL